MNNFDIRMIAKGYRYVISHPEFGELYFKSKDHVGSYLRRYYSNVKNIKTRVLINENESINANK